MGNSASALPYSIDNQVGTDEFGWNIHHGTKKSDKSEVTVFVGKKPAMLQTQADKSGRHRGMMQLQPALHHFQHCKRVRHPHILEVYATLDTDNPDDSAAAAASNSNAPIDPKTATGDLIVVTEPCVSLQTWLQTNRPTDEQLAWGLQSMVNALHFLHSSAQLAHGLIMPSSFYVNRAGDMKLWNFSLVTPVGDNLGPTRHFREWDAVLCSPTYRSPERVEQRWEAIQTAGIHSMDAYSLGVLVGTYYQAAGHATIPAPLQKAVQRLQTPNVRMRPRLQPLLKCPLFQSPYQTLQQQLSELSVQPVEQKIAFWQQLGQQLNNAAGPNSGIVDQSMAVYKLMPLIRTTIKTICNNEGMMAQDMYRREVLAVMTPLFFIAENYLTGEDFNKEMKPLIGLLFNVKDRGVRGLLLQKMSLLTTNLDARTLNASVFEPMCSGFSDSSPALRELTLKSTLGLVQHLTAPNLEKLTRYLVRLQGDTEVSIRTNTIIFISKITSHLGPVARDKMILPAFMRALRDTFAPCRLAALQCMTGTFDCFEPQGLAGKLLPSIAPHLLDPDTNVRTEAFKVSEALLVTLKVESNKMTANEQAQRAKQQVAQQGVRSAPSSGNMPTSTTTPSDDTSSTSYLAGFASWMASSALPTSTTAEAQPMQPQAPNAAATASNVGVPAPQQRPPPAPNSAPLQLPSQKPITPTTTAVQQQFGSMKMNDGWDDVDDGDDGLGGGDDGGWGDEDLEFSAGAAVEEDPFASIGMKKSTAGTAPAKNLSIGGSKKLVMPITKKIVSSPAPAPVAVTKLAVDDDEIADGWDDF